VRTRRQRAGPALLWISVNCAARYAVPPDRPRQNPAAARQFAELNENRRVDERIRLAVRLPSRDTARRATGLAPLSTRGSRGARTPTCWNARAPPIAPKTDRGHAEPPPNADRRVADVLPVERQRAGVATAQRRQHGSALGAVAVVDAGRVEQGGHDVDELKRGWSATARRWSEVVAAQDGTDRMVAQHGDLHVLRLRTSSAGRSLGDDGFTDTTAAQDFEPVRRSSASMTVGQTSIS
jgi:hypothetical protein